MRMIQIGKAYGLRIAKLKNKQSRHNKKKRKTLRSIKYGFVDAAREKNGEESYESGVFSEILKSKKSQDLCTFFKRNFLSLLSKF